MLSRRPSHAVAELLVAGALLPAVASGSSGDPDVRRPRLTGEAPAFGGIVAVTVANSDWRTRVRVCVSGHCRRLYRDGQDEYSAAGALFGVRLRRGQRRTVLVSASNARGREFWGPTRVTVR